VVGIVICPMLFYIPKFFELRTVFTTYSFNVTIDCAVLFGPPNGYNETHLNGEINITASRYSISPSLGSFQPLRNGVLKSLRIIR
jgi:hypothetical protein